MLDPGCRRAALAACETMSNFTTDARPPLNSTMITVRIGDVLDVGILWGDWLTANAARIKASSWAAAGSPVASPDSPTIVPDSELFDRKTGETVCLIDASAAAVGDIYYLENTVTLETDEDSENFSIVLPDRTVTRRIHVQVAAG
jgi:hypothetical protein